MRNNTRSPLSFRFFGRPSLTWNIVIGIAGVVSLVSILSLTLDLIVVTRERQNDFDRKSGEYLAYLRQSLEVPLWNYDFLSIAKLGEMTMSSDIVTSLVIMDGRGNAVFDSKKPDEDKDAVKRETIRYRDRVVGSVALGFTMREYREHRRHMISVSLMTMCGVILGILAAVVFLVERALMRPLGTFSKRIDAVAAGDYHAGGDADIYVELSSIWERFNQMASRIRDREVLLVAANQALRAEIAERKKADVLLRDNEQRYRSLNENMPVGVFRSTPEGRIVSMNPSLRQMLSLAADAPLEGIRAAEFYVEPADRHLMLDRIRADGQVSGYECRLKACDGAVFWVDESAGGIRDDAGQLIYIDGVIADITARKQAELALQESEFRFRTLYQSNPQGIVLMDLDGRILDANKQILKVSGYALTDILGRHVKSFVADTHHPEVDKVFVAIKAGVSQDEPMEIVARKKDGSELAVSIRGWLITDHQSRPVSLGVFVHDLTREKRLAEEKASLERQLIQIQKMEAVGTLAGGIAHDFNNILSGIIGYAEMALIDPAVLSEKHRRYITRVLKAGNRARELVGQILSFSRPDESAMGIVSLGTILRESARLMASTIPSTIRIEMRLLASADTVAGHAIQIQQVIMNLCTNAYHAMREKGGVLTLSLENETLAKPKEYLNLHAPAGDYVRLTVADEGCGIEPHVLDRIYDPYFTTKKPGEGTGLGLSVTLGIMRSHNGLIAVESVLGQGTRFSLFFPIRRDGCSDQPRPDRNPPRGENERILLVDDEPYILEACSGHLESLGYRVLTASRGAQALEIIRREPAAVDLLITDQTMPEMTGVTLVSEIRGFNANQPVILCTGYLDAATAAAAHAFGIRRIIMKPVRREDLGWEVHRALRERDPGFHESGPDGREGSALCEAGAANNEK